MANDFSKFIKGIIVKPEASDPVETVEGIIAINSSDNLIKAYIQGALRQIVTHSQVQSLSNKSLVDASTQVVDSSDPTKAIKFDAGGTASTATTIAAAQTANRTLNLPDANDTLVARNTTDTLTNKTIAAGSNTITGLTNSNIDNAAAIDRSKLAAGTADHIIINDGSGVLSSEATLAKVRGGTGQDNSSLTFPASGTLATLLGTETLENKSLVDANTAIVDSSDSSRQIKFDAGGTAATSSTIAAAQTANRVLTLPDATDTLAGVAATQTLTNKTIDASANTLSNISDSAISALAAIARSKLASGTASHVLINDGSGVMSSEATLAKSRGGSGQDNSSLTFPASGTLATLAGTETLTNKTFGDAIIGTQIATPSSPSAGRNKLYFKSDDKLYKLNSSGSEEEVGTGAGGSGKNYITNFGAESATTGWASYQDAASGVPVDGTGGSPGAGFGFTRETSSPLSGAGMFYRSELFGLNQGAGVSYDFTVDRADGGKIFDIEFDYRGSQATGDLVVYIYRVTATSRLIQPSNYIIQNSPNSVSRFRAQFQTDDGLTTVTYRLIIHNATGWTGDFYFDNVRVGPSVGIEAAPVMSDYQSYTPTVDGAGTPSTLEAEWRRVGDSLQARVLLVPGTPSATEARIYLPSGLSTAGTDKLPSRRICGYGAANSAHSGMWTILAEANKTYVNVSLQGSAQDGYDIVNGNSLWGSGIEYAYDFMVPIKGWGSASDVIAAGDGRTVALLATSSSTATANSTTPIVYETKVKDTHSGLNTSTGRYTVPIAGVYFVKASYYSATTDYGFVYKNGNIAFQIQNGNAGLEAGAGILDCVAGDIIDVRPNLSHTMSNGPDYAKFEVFRVSGPETIQAGERISARATRAATQSIADSTQVKVQFDTESYDSHGAMDVASTYRFVCPAPGVYAVSALVEFDANATGQRAVTLYKNGSAYAELGQEPNPSAGASTRCGGSDDIELVAGDYIEIYVFQSSGGALNIGVNGSQFNRFAVKRIK